MSATAQGSPTTSHVAPPALSRSGPIPSLDGLRAVSFTIVFLSHIGLGKIVPGRFGVTVFFVLSGFLITTLMRQEFAATGRLDLKGFYLRRVLRILPPLYISIALLGLAWKAGLTENGGNAGGWASLAFQYANYWSAIFGFETLPAGGGPMWSLAVEEHFYLLWPPVAIALLSRAPGLREKTATWWLGLACLLILAWRAVLHFLPNVPEDYIINATDTRADALLVGCWLALAMNPWLDTLPAPNPRRDGILVLVGFGVIGLTLVIRNTVFRDTLRYDLQEFAVADLLWLAVARPTARPWRWLNTKSLMWIGTLSYALYLLHDLCIHLVTHHFGPELKWYWQGLLAAPLALLLAWLMKRLVEDPLAQVRKRLHASRTSAAASRQ